MSLSEKDIKVIDDHLLGRLSPTGSDYYSQIKDRPEVVQYIQDHQEIVRAVQRKGKKLLKGKLQTYEQDISSSTKKSATIRSLRAPLAVAASLLLMAAFVYLMRSNSGPTDAQLYADHYRPYPNLVDPITKSSAQDRSAYQYYEARHYDQALSSLQALPPSDDKDWYLAMTYVGLENYEVADELLDAILQNDQHNYYQPAQWYKALVKIQDHDQDKGKHWLKIIAADQEHPYYERARRLLQEL